MRIVHVVDYLMPKFGYHEKLLPKWNKKHGHEIIVVTSNRYTPIKNYNQIWKPILGDRIITSGRVIEDSILVIRLNVIFEFHSMPWLSNLELTLDSCKPNIIFSHGTSSFNSFRLAHYSNKSKIPVILDNHMIRDVKSTTPIFKFLYLFVKIGTKLYLNKHIAAFIGLTKQCYDFMVVDQGVTSSKSTVVELSVDTELFHPLDNHEKYKILYRSKFKIPNKSFVIMQSGKLTDEKKPQWLAKVFSQILKSKIDNVSLVFIGEAEKTMRKKIRSYFDEQTLKSLYFIPFVPARELKYYFNMADLVVYPDGVSLSALEVSACKKTVIMTDIKAAKQRNLKGIGVCYQRGNLSNLKELIIKIYNNSKFHNEIAERSYLSVLKHFTYDVHASNIEKIMRMILIKNEKYIQ